MKMYLMEAAGDSPCLAQLAKLFCTWLILIVNAIESLLQNKLNHTVVGVNV